MSALKEIFADGVGQIHFVGGMIRLDFVTLEPGENDDTPSSKEAFRLIMPQQGFLQAFNSMRQLLDQLVEAGVMQRDTGEK